MEEVLRELHRTEFEPPRESGHGIWRCSCGALIRQCRCIHNKQNIHIVPITLRDLSTAPAFNDPVTITAPRWVFDTLIVAAQMENDRRQQDDPTEATRFLDAWLIVHRFLSFEDPAGSDAIADSHRSPWRRRYPASTSPTVPAADTPTMTDLPLFALVAD